MCPQKRKASSDFFFLLILKASMDTFKEKYSKSIIKNFKELKGPTPLYLSDSKEILLSTYASISTDQFINYYIDKLNPFAFYQVVILLVR